MKYLNILDNQYIRLDSIDYFVIAPKYVLDNKIIWNVLAESLNNETTWIVEYFEKEEQAIEYLKNLMKKINGE